MTTDDPYTMELALCDEAGAADLEVLNRLRDAGGHEPYGGEPFACTGHAHLAGEHIRCTSSAHENVFAEGRSLNGWQVATGDAAVTSTTAPRRPELRLIPGGKA